MKKYPAALAASAVFVAAIRLFRAPYLAWERLWLVTGFSLLAAVSFGVIVWLTLAQRRTLSKKRSAAVLLSASAVLAAVQWSVILAVNKDGLYNEKAADAAGSAVFLLFGAALCVFFAVSAARKKRTRGENHLRDAFGGGLCSCRVGALSGPPSAVPA